MKKPETTVFVSNVSEDVWPFIQNISDPLEAKFEIEENANLSDRMLFSLTDEGNALFITPKSISKNFLNYFFDVFGFKKIEILVPKQHSGEICKDVIDDKRLVKRLLEFSGGKKLKLIPYSTTPQFLELVEFLKSLNVDTSTPESPSRKDFWTVDFFGSKSGIRKLAEETRMEGFKFPVADGVVIFGRGIAAKIATQKYLKEGGVVLKTNKGHAGAGVLIFRKGDLPSLARACEKKIFWLLKRNTYWEKFPIVVESLINVDGSIAGGYPNAEFKIRDKGAIEFLYFCGMRITEKGEFKGVEINHEVIPRRLQNQIIKIGVYIGRKYSQAGYRGYFDVDFAVSRGGTLFLTESNVRRTGGTHVFHVAKKIFGKSFMEKTYTLSNTFPLPKNFSFVEILKGLGPTLFDKKKKEGLIVVSENLLKQKQLAYIIFGKTKQKALEIENQMEELMQS